jgi:hypothetical protein
VVSLGVFLLIVVPFAGLLGRFHINSQVEVLLAGDQRNFESYQKIKDIISTDLPIFVSMEVPDIYTHEGITAIHEVSEAFVGMDGFVDAKSLTHSYKPVRSGMSFQMVPLASTNRTDPQTLEQLREYCRENPLVRNIMTSPDDRHNIIWLTFRREFSDSTSERASELRTFRDELYSRLEPFEERGYGFELIGIPLVESEVYQTILQDARQFILISACLLIILFGLTFRSLSAATLVAINLAISFLILPILFVVMGFELTVFNLILLPLLGVIHLTLLTHLFLAFLSSRRAGEPQPVQAALKRIWKSSAFASLTTAVSFGSLALSEVTQVASFGILGGIGMIVLFFLTFGPGISVLSIAERLKLFKAGSPSVSAGKEIDGCSGVAELSSQSGTSEDSAWAASLVDWTTRHASRIILGTVIASFLIGWGLTRVRTDVRIEEFLSRDSPTRRMMMEMDQVYGGMNVLQLYIDSGEEYGIASVEFLNFLRDVEQSSTAIDGVTGVYSFAQVMAMMNQVWEREKPGSLKIPDSSFLVTMFVGALKAQDYPFLKTLCDEDLQTANLVIRTRNMPSGEYLNLVDQLIELTRAKAPEGTEVSARATIKSLLEADRRILHSQTSTAASTLGIVLILLVILWRSMRTGMISMTANLLPVAMVISLTGWFSVPLNSITIMVGAIAFGIAVDDSVHFLTYFRELKKNRGMNTRDALVEAFHVKGRPIFFTSIMLVAIFLSLSLSSFPPVRHFGVLGAMAFIGALISIFLLIPALETILPGNNRTRPAPCGTAGSD